MLNLINRINSIDDLQPVELLLIEWYLIIQVKDVNSVNAVNLYCEYKSWYGPTVVMYLDQIDRRWLFGVFLDIRHTNVAAYSIHPII